MSGVNVKRAKEYLLEKEKRVRHLRVIERDTVISELQALNSLWEKYGIEKVYLYGSFTDSSFRECSDIDLAIEPDIPYKELLLLFSEVNKKVKREVDVRLLSELPFHKMVTKNGIIVYERKNSHT